MALHMRDLVKFFHTLQTGLSTVPFIVFISHKFRLQCSIAWQQTQHFLESIASFLKTKPVTSLIWKNVLNGETTVYMYWK